MSEGSVNVESRTSSQDKRWTIMAALLGTSTAVLLFQGIEQEKNYKFVREVALTIIAATIPFQGIYFLIYTFLLENNGRLNEDMLNRLNMASALCQVAAYLSGFDHRSSRPDPQREGHPRHPTARDRHGGCRSRF